VVSFTPHRFTPGVRDPGTHCIGGVVGPRARMDMAVKRELLSLPLPGIKPQ